MEVRGLTKVRAAQAKESQVEWLADSSSRSHVRSGSGDDTSPEHPAAGSSRQRCNK
jgi:hypothetical protein